MMQFDYVIVGAGSSGCVLANRLSENPSNRVLLVEAGGENKSLFIKMAGGFVRIMGNPDYFWAFPVIQMPGRRKEMHIYGRGLGGSSAVNGTWYMQGEPRDFDGWRDMGLSGWGWNGIARQYKSFESYRAPGAAPMRGTDGPLEITPSEHDSDVFRALIAACESFGVPYLDDINTPGVEGVGRTQYTVDRKGRRSSSYEAFVAPVRSRPNLAVLTGHAVKRVLIEEGRATGILCERDGEEVSYSAARDVILSAGVYMSPAILQRSGIGPGELLNSHGIEVVKDNPAVGENLCDHQKLGISYDLNGHPGTNREFTGWRLYANAMRYLATGTGPLARVGMPLTMMWSSEGEHDWPDFQLAAAPFAMRTVKEMAAEPGSPISARPGITFSGYHLRPKSRGTVAITSGNWRDMSLVDPPLWQDASDQTKALDLLKALRRIAAAPVLKPFVGVERSPGGEFLTDEELISELRNLVDPGLHGTGSCSMGTDPSASVVDDRCRVHGIVGLRVVDCSIMPTPVSGNTNGPAMAIAARAAELILDDPDASSRGRSAAQHEPA